MNIEQSIANAVGMLRRMIEIPSVSREEREVADFLQQSIHQMGFDTHRKGNNIWCIGKHFEEQKPTLLLNSHIDTVKPVAGWTRHPFTATACPEPSRREESVLSSVEEPVLSSVEGHGCLYGLGSNDAGASVVSLLQTFYRLTMEEQPYNIVFLASCEEEVSGKNGIECVLPLLPKIDVALVGEPTNMQPAIAEKGLMVLDVCAHGKAGHAARNEGVNAIYLAMDDLRWFRNYRFQRESPLLGAVKMTVTQINAGTQHNVIPDTCSMVVDVRSNECYTNHELFDEICQHIQSEAKARSFRLNSSHIALSHPLVQRAIGLGRKPFGSPTLSDQALMSFPSMKMGPGDSSRSHTADEFVRIDEIAEGIDLYYQLLNKTNLGGVVR